MSSGDSSSEFSAALAAYLSTLLSVGDCVAATAPEVGGAYRQRLNQLRDRVAFEPTAEAMTAATTTLDSELKEYAEVASRQAARQTADLRTDLGSLSEALKHLAGRQIFYGERLRQFATHMQSMHCPRPDPMLNAVDPEHLAEILELQSRNLVDCVDSMACETAGLTARMREELAALDERLARL
jgi:hypothetical protein